MTSYILNAIKNLTVKHKCKYCGCSIQTDDIYCSYECSINDNRKHFSDNDINSNNAKSSNNTNSKSAKPSNNTN